MIVMVRLYVKQNYVNKRNCRRCRLNKPAMHSKDKTALSIYCQQINTTIATINCCKVLQIIWLYMTFHPCKNYSTFNAYTLKGSNKV